MHKWYEVKADVDENGKILESPLSPELVKYLQAGVSELAAKFAMDVANYYFFT